MLQGHTAQSGEPFRMRGAQLRNFLILNLDDLAREILIRPIPKRIDRQGLDINSHFIQIREMFFNIIVHVGGIVRTCLRRIARAPLAPDAILDEIPGFRHANMSVNVNDLHAPATEKNIPAAALDTPFRNSLRFGIVDSQLFASFDFRLAIPDGPTYTPEASRRERRYCFWFECRRSL
jgi:hypothetical protein